MNETTLERPEITAYLAALRDALADVPADERDELLADVETSLLESGDETMSRPPEAFATELREAAGLQPSERRPDRWAVLRRRLRDVAGNEQLRELAPVWWVGRALTAGAVLGLLTLTTWPLQSNEVVGPAALWLLLTAAAVVGSIWLGFRTRTGSVALRRSVAVVNAALALALVAVVPAALETLRSESVRYEPIAVGTPGLAVDGTPVTNIYPYSRDGELLYDVLLYDEAGRPLNAEMAPDDTRRVLVDRFGTPILNSFPVRYYEPGTKTVARPDLAPPVSLPQIETPPLEGSQAEALPSR